MAKGMKRKRKQRKAAPKNYWNHRVVRYKDPFEAGAYYYRICEVYYRNGKPSSFAEDKSPGGMSLKELRETLNRMKRSLKKPPLEAKVQRTTIREVLRRRK